MTTVINDKKTDLSGPHPVLDGEPLLEEDGGIYDRQSFNELKAWVDTQKGLNPENWFRNLLAAKRNVVKPFSDQFRKAYDSIALESARRQMSLNDELLRVGTSKGWHLDLANSVLELDGIPLPGAILLGTNTLGEFLWADENHPSAQNLAPYSMRTLRTLRCKFPDIPEVVSSGIQVQGALDDPASIGYLVSAIASVAMGPTWAYYRAPRSETSWGWITFDATPLGGVFSRSNANNIATPVQLANELRRFGVQLALSPIVPFDFRRAALDFVKRRFSGGNLDKLNNKLIISVLEERSLSEKEASRVLHDKELAVAENDRPLSNNNNSKDLSSSKIDGPDDDVVDDIDDSLDVEFVSEPESEGTSVTGWTRLMIWLPNTPRTDSNSNLLASLVFDGQGRVHKVGCKVTGANFTDISAQTQQQQQQTNTTTSSSTSTSTSSTNSVGNENDSSARVNDSSSTNSISAPLLQRGDHPRPKEEECCSVNKCTIL